MKKKYIEMAKACETFQEIETFLKQIENTINDNFYYQLKDIAETSVYNLIRFGIENKTVYSI